MKKKNNISEYLHPGEEIIAEYKTHWSIFLRPGTVIPFVIAVVALILFYPWEGLVSEFQKEYSGFSNSSEPWYIKIFIGYMAYPLILIMSFSMDRLDKFIYDELLNGDVSRWFLSVLLLFIAWKYLKYVLNHISLFFQMRYQSFFLTNQKRLIYKSGMFSKYIDELHTQNIEKIDVYQTWHHRIFKCGNIGIRQKNRTQDSFVLRNIQNPFDVRKILLSKNQIMDQEEPPVPESP